MRSTALFVGVVVVVSVQGCGSAKAPASNVIVAPPTAQSSFVPGTNPSTTGGATTAPPVTPPASSGGAVSPVLGMAGAPAVMGAAGTTAPAPVMMMGTAGAPAPSSTDSLYDAATKTLRAPAAGDGVQIQTSLFDLAAGAEKFACYHAEIPVDGEIDVRYYESAMAEGSHHFILYTSDGDTVPVGTMEQNGCLTAFGGWIYSSAQPHIDLKIPEGVAFVLGSRQRVQFDMHYINTTQQTLHAQVTLNVIFAKGTFQKAKSLISFNSSIAIPANGTQTVGGDCTPGSGAKFFYMLSHTHRRGTLATITRVLANGMMGEELLRSTNWEVPQEKKYLTDPFLTFQPGEKFHYSCNYQNDLPQVVTAGPSADTNEMCMAITYFFPASAGGSCN